jgi:signal peptidase II
LIFFLALASTLAIDQLSKALIRIYLPPGEFARVMGEFLIFNQQRNSGIAFSLFTGGSNALIVTLTMLLVVLLIVYVFWSRTTDRLALAGLGLICGGALGNIIDRLAFSHVVDFVDFSFWPVFNLADAAIVVGVGLFLISVLRSFGVDKAEEGSGENAS